MTTIEPNIGVVPVPDPRLDALAALIQPDKVVPATLRVVDIAGLVRGASQGEGLGNEFLSHIRAVDAIAMVVRCFVDEQVPHVTAALHPVDDMETVDLELMLSDLQILDRHLERLQSRAKANPREFAEELALVERVMACLRQGMPLRRQGLTAEEQYLLREVALLTNKPLLYVANVTEDSLPDGGPLAEAVRARAEEEGAEVITLCAQTEAEIGDWPPRRRGATWPRWGWKSRASTALCARATACLTMSLSLPSPGVRKCAPGRYIAAERPGMPRGRSTPICNGVLSARRSSAGRLWSRRGRSPAPEIRGA